MKNAVKISGMFLMLFIAGSLSLSAQRGMRGMRPDSTRMNRMRMEHRQMPLMMQNPDSLKMGGMRHGMGHAGMGMNAGTGMKIMESIPNLTDKQKKDIAELRQKQQEEMLKFRSDMQGKMKEMRETNRTKVMNLLTDDQKKWFEENTPKPLNK